MGDSLTVAQLEGIFKKFDIDGDGKISASELGEALKAIGSATPDEAKSMMASIDSDGDGEISFDEFIAFANKHPAVMKNFL